MSAPAALRGTFSDFKLIRGRKVAQLVIEVPIEQADAALQALGGIPNPADERWVAVARLQPEAKAQPVSDRPVPTLGIADRAKQESDEEGRRRRFHEMNPAAQIAMSCSLPSFREFLRAREGYIHDDADTCDAWVKGILRVRSKTEVVPGSQAFAKWNELRGNYEVWLRYERSAA
jgi:hypothetical protein